MAALPLFLLTFVLAHLGHCAYINMGIVNGSVVKEYSRPYMVSVQQGGRHHCGGFLVSENFVMTAAHCWKPGIKLTVIVGAPDLKKVRPALTHLAVKLYHIHPMFDVENYLNDIMLLQLNKPIKKAKNINWIPIPQNKKNEVNAKQVCSIAGWGKQAENGGLSDRLMEVNVTVMDPKTCKKYWQKPFSASSLVCTSGHGGFLEGDSGGPLVCKNTAVGIVSFYSSTKFPYVYTKISRFLPWINCILGHTE